LVNPQRGGKAMGIFDKAKDALSGQEDKVDAGVEQAGDMVDEKTEGKYAEQVDQGQEMAKDKLGDLTGNQPE
jgi:antitoxin protein of toxin-antitoxin system